MSGAGLDVSGLSPSDAAVALRSYPRRFRSLLTGLEPDEELDAEAVAHAAELGRVLAQISNALGQVLSRDDAVIPAGVLDEGQRDWTMPADDDVERVLAGLAAEAEGLAAVSGRVAADDWKRTGQVTGGATVTALDLLRQAVVAGHRHLRDAEAAQRAAGR